MISLSPPQPRPAPLERGPCQNISVRPQNNLPPPAMYCRFSVDSPSSRLLLYAEFLTQGRHVCTASCSVCSRIKIPMSCTLFENRLRTPYSILLLDFRHTVRPNSPMVSDLPTPLLEFHGIAGNWTRFSIGHHIAWTSPLGKRDIVNLPSQTFCATRMYTPLFSLPTHIQFYSSLPKVGSKAVKRIRYDVRMY